MKNILVTLILIFLIISGILAGYWLGFKDGTKYLQVVGTQELKLNSGSALSQNSGGLQVYHDDTLSYDISYPDTFVVDKGSNGSVKILKKSTKDYETEQLAKCKETVAQGKTDTSCGMADAVYTDGLVISKVDTKLSFADYIASLSKDGTITSKNDITINGFQAVDTKGMGLSSNSVYVTDGKGKIIDIGRFSNLSDDFDQIVKSFKFTN